MCKFFERKAVLFIDILGFKEKVDNCNEDNSQITNIYNVLSIMKNHFYKNKDLKRIHFSDSIVISFNAEEHGAILDIIGSIQSLVKKIVNEGFLLRGGITVGNVYHDDDFIYGPAMNKAYYLESKIAKNPRIIIDPEIIELSKNNMPEFFNEGMEEYIYNYISIDSDDNHYIDYFKKGVDTFWEINDNDKRYVDKLNEIIQQGLKIPDKEINSKYIWMRDKHNDLIKNLKSNTQIKGEIFTMGSDKESSYYQNLEIIA